MTANTFGTLDVLLKHAEEDNLTELLPENLLVESPHPEKIPLNSISFNLKWLATIHPSWIALAMKSYPMEVVNQILAWLPENLAHELFTLLPGSSIATNPCSDFGAFYLLNMLSKQVRPIGVVEEIFLPISPFNSMLYYSATTKTTLVNCLGLFALAIELKNVVNKVTLEKIDSYLSSTEKLFLKYCRSHPMRYLDSVSFLDSWSSDALYSDKKLKYFLHKEGLKILAKALAKEDASFLWYFLRRLDVKRGFILESSLQSAINFPHVEYFKNRVIQCMKVLVK